MAHRYAIVFGLNYPGQKHELHGCVNDARFWAGTAKWMGFDDVKILTNKRCTKKNMVRAIEAGLQRAKTGDLVAIVYSGHGTEAIPGTQGWVPDDLDWKKPETWLTYDELDRLFMVHEQKGVLVVVVTDSCFSKADPRIHFRKVSDRSSKMKVRFLEPPPEIRSRIVADSFHRNVLTTDQDDLLISAAQKNQISADDEIDGKFHGAFSYAMALVLEEKPTISYHDAVLKARAWLAENGYDQVPSATGAPDLVKLRFFTTPPRHR